MKLSDEGVDRLVLREGLETTAYLDSANVWTIGVGHTATARQGMKISKDGAMSLFRRDVVWAEEAVNKYTNKGLNQDQFDALVSFVFNIGSGAFKNSQLLRELNKGRFHLVPVQLMRWNKVTVGGEKRIEPGLVYRRTAEAAQWYASRIEKEYQCSLKPCSPEGRSVVQLLNPVSGSKTMTSGFVGSGLSVAALTDQLDGVQMATDKAGGLLESLTSLPIPTIIIMGLLGLFLFTMYRRYSDSQNGKNY